MAKIYFTVETYQSDRWEVSTTEFVRSRAIDIARDNRDFTYRQFRVVEQPSGYEIWPTDERAAS